MKKRYMVPKMALVILSTCGLDAITELGSSKIITHETLEYRSFDLVSMMLDEDEIKELQKNGINPTLEGKEDNCLLAPIGYEKVRSRWYKTEKRAFTGKNVKVAVLDTGCNVSVVPCDVQKNFIDNNEDATDVYGHGTQVCSIIKHPDIGIVKECHLTIIKCIGDAGNLIESAIAAGLDYCSQNDIDFINCSWQCAPYQSIQDGMTAVINSGTIPCVASGNSSVEAYTSFPAWWPGTIAVNAAAPNGTPGYKNVNPPGDPPIHGPNVACSGVGCQVYRKDGSYGSNWGTSLAAPYFVGVLAMYKQMMGYPSSNRAVADYALERCMKWKSAGYTDKYYGAGIPSF